MNRSAGMNCHLSRTAEIQATKSFLTGKKGRGTIVEHADVLFADLTTGRVIWIGRGKTAETLGRFFATSNTRSRPTDAAAVAPTKIKTLGEIR